VWPGEAGFIMSFGEKVWLKARDQKLSPKIEFQNKKEKHTKIVILYTSKCYTILTPSLPMSSTIIPIPLLL
jgi:hypothetical protein